VAELLTLYPRDHDIYFLARDSEYLYDVARLVTEGTLDAKRIHLLNVSRGNMRDPLAAAYLDQEGISVKSLVANQKVLFVDTGFSGTIPKVLTELFPDKFRTQIKTHLIVSETPRHPSSRAFLIHLNPAVNSLGPKSLHGTIINYEHMPRTTARSSKFMFLNGRIHAVSIQRAEPGETVSLKQSLKYMADLKYEWQKERTQRRFLHTKKQINTLMDILSTGSADSIARLRRELAERGNSMEGNLLEALIRDIMGAQGNANMSIKFRLSDLGLNANDGALDSGMNSKKHELMTKVPEWSHILENPEFEISRRTLSWNQNARTVPARNRNDGRIAKTNAPSG
jgi:hypothetical protein